MFANVSTNSTFVNQAVISVSPTPEKGFITWCNSILQIGRNSLWLNFITYNLYSLKLSIVQQLLAFTMALSLGSILSLECSFPNNPQNVTSPSLFPARPLTSVPQSNHRKSHQQRVSSVTRVNWLSRSWSLGPVTGEEIQEDRGYRPPTISVDHWSMLLDLNSF